MKMRATVLAAGLGLVALAGAGAAPPSVRIAPGPAATPRLSVPLGSLPVAGDALPWNQKAEDRFNPLAGLPDQGRGDTWAPGPVAPDPLAARSLAPGRETPAPALDFAGTGNPAGCGGCTPPDTNGDVGPHHYVQMVNATKVAIYDKSGALLAGPSDLSLLFSFAPCNGNDGDPVVVYDPLADRWVLAQFASPHDLCIAVSQSADPLGSYFTYDFVTVNFPDYFKIGIWRDGYYVTTNENNYSAWVLDRSAMLAGQASSSIRASFAAANFLLPADVDGLLAPPAGAPGLYYTFLDDSFHGGADRLEVYAFAVDWVTPANSTFTTLATIPIASYTYTVCGFFNLNCAPQAGTAQKVDVVSEWPMHRLAYRNAGAFESLVGTFTVDAGGDVAAPRWFELRRAGGGAWTLHQEGTWAPDGSSRYMGAIAADHFGGIALGYTASSAALAPAIRYATRLAADPAGTLSAEATLVAGGGSQTGSNRWGDYSAMAVDPADDCTFWYTNEYYVASSSTGWATRVGAFRMPECTVLFLDDFETGGTTRWSAAAP